MQRYVEALGGHLEIKAVFQEDSKELLAKKNFLEPIQKQHNCMK